MTPGILNGLCFDYSGCKKKNFEDQISVIKRPSCDKPPHCGRLMTNTTHKISVFFRCGIKRIVILLRHKLNPGVSSMGEKTQVLPQKKIANISQLISATTTTESARIFGITEHLA